MKDRFMVSHAKLLPNAPLAPNQALNRPAYASNKCNSDWRWTECISLTEVCTQISRATFNILKPTHISWGCLFGHSESKPEMELSKQVSHFLTPIP